MSDKTKMSNLESYQELTIQISTLNMKLDKILELLNEPKQDLIPDLQIKSNAEILQEEWKASPQWPNESRTDYLKRIGQWNVASSDDETFLEEFK